MLTRIILTVIGSDRPGLTGALADAVHAAGGNWLESQLSRLAGKYVGAVLVELPADRLAALHDNIAAVDAAGLNVSVVAAGAADQPGAALRLQVIGQDRPGIVREVSTALGALHVNIVRLQSAIEDSAWSGGRLFRAEADLLLPPDLDEEAVRAALEDISAEIMVDFISPGAPQPAA